jgi:hypothetical protein
MDEMSQLATAMLTLIFAAVMLVAGQLFIGTRAEKAATAVVNSFPGGLLAAPAAAQARAGQRPSLIVDERRMSAK